MRKIMLLWLLVALLPLTLGQVSLSSDGWHNDPGNDSCLTAYSDKAVYLADRTNPIIEPVVKVVNDCGRTVTGNLGVFLQTKDMAATIYSMEQATATIPIVLSKNYVCWQTSAFDEKTGIGTCYKEDVNGSSTIFEREIDKLEEKTFYWTETYYSPQFFGNAEKQEVPVLSPNKDGFEKKASYQAMNFAPGETYLRVGMNLPKGTLHRHGYFIFTIEDSEEKSFKTVLDPEWWETGEYVADVNTVAMWHCNDSAGTTVTDATGNFDGTASNALIWDTNNPKWGAGACGLDELYYFSNDTLLDVGFPTEWTMEAWVYPLVTFEIGMTHSSLWGKYNVSGTNYLQTYFNPDGKLYIAIVSTSVSDLLSAKDVWAGNTWIHVMIVNDGTTWAMFIDGDRQGTENFGTPMAAGTFKDFYFGTSMVTPGTQISNALFDEIVISDANRFAIPPSFPVTSTVDVNLSKIEGLDFSGLPFYSYAADGNLAIDFNIFDPFNSRISVDMNYSASAVQGTGTPFYTDLNLTLEFCDILDWNTASAKCSLDWNIMGLGDNNYYILISAASSSDADFSASAAKVGIDNNAPTIASYAPVANQSASTPTVSFVLELSDFSKPYRVYAGYYFNGVLDYNETKDVNAGNFALFSYPVLFAVNDSVYLVVNHVEDIAGNYGNTIQKTGSHIRTVLNPVDVENITTEDIERGTQAMLYNFFVKFGSASGFLVVLILALLLAFLVLKGATGG